MRRYISERSTWQGVIPKSTYQDSLGSIHKQDVGLAGEASLAPYLCALIHATPPLGMHHTSDYRRSRSGSHSSIDANVDDCLLPHTTTASPSEKRLPYLKRQQLRFALAALLTLVCVVLVWIWLFLNGRVGLAGPILRVLAKESGLPPLYAEFHQMELSLPQHNMAVSNSSNVKYLWIANHVRGAAHLRCQ